MKEQKKNYGAKYKYLILVSLGLVAFIVMFAQYQMQPVANEIKETFSLNDSQFSALFTASMMPAIFISLICGIIVDKIGGRWPMFISLCIGAIGLWGRVFTSSFGIMYTCMFVIGFAATFGNAANVKMFAGWFTPSECGICIGIYMALASIGCAAGTGTTPFMPSLRIAYMVSAVIITAAAVIWFLFYRDWKDTGNAESTEEKTADNKESLLVTIKTVLKQKDILLAGVGDLCLYGGLMTLNTFLGMVLADKGLEAAAVGTVAALVSIGMFIGNLVIPQIAARAGKVRSLLVICGLAGSALMLASAYLPGGMLLNIALTLAGFTIGGCVPVIMSLPLRIAAVGAERTATAGGIIATFQLFGAVVIPTYVIANLAGGNYTMLVVLSAAMSLIGTIILRCISKGVK